MTENQTHKLDLGDWVRVEAPGEPAGQVVGLLDTGGLHGDLNPTSYQGDDVYLVLENTGTEDRHLAVRPGKLLHIIGEGDLEQEEGVPDGYSLEDDDADTVTLFLAEASCVHWDSDQYVDLPLKAVHINGMGSYVRLGPYSFTAAEAREASRQLANAAMSADPSYQQRLWTKGDLETEARRLGFIR